MEEVNHVSVRRIRSLSVADIKSRKYSRLEITLRILVYKTNNEFRGEPSGVAFGAGCGSELEFECEELMTHSIAAKIGRYLTG